MDVDKQHEIYQNGFKAGQNHSNPSPKTLEEISNLKIHFATMQEQIKSGFEYIGEKVDSLAQTLKDHIDDENLIHKDHDARIKDVELWRANFAGKMYMIVTIIAFLGSIISPIIVNYLIK